MLTHIEPDVAWSWLTRLQGKWSRQDRGHATKCWIWGKALSPRGRAQWSYTSANGRRCTTTGHRAVYLTLIGDVPVGLELDHLCMVPECVNPWHLEPVTPAENNRRAVEAFRAGQGTSCAVHGQSEGRWTLRGRRLWLCAACQRDRVAPRSASTVGSSSGA